MAWDDTKQADDLIKSSEWNTMVTDQKGRVIGTNVTEAIADTSGNLPSAGSPGRLLFETDTGRVLYDNGTSLVEVGLSESQISLSNLSSNSYADLSDGTSFPIPNADLNNSSLTVGNTSISLGGSGTPNVSDLDGSGGSSGQFLQTDGSNLSFSDVSTFSGEFVDLENVPTLGMTDDQRQSLNELFQATARNQFQNNLTQLNYGGGIFTIYRDSTKISSNSDVNISTLNGGDIDGTAKLSQIISTVNLDDFEDGTTGNFTQPSNFGTLQAQSSFVIDGSQTLEMEVSDDFTVFEANYNLSDSQPRAIRFKASTDTDGTFTTSGDGFIINLKDSNGKRIVDINFDQTTDLLFNGTKIASYGTKDVFDIELRNLDYTKKEFDLFVNGTDKGTLSFDQSDANGFTKIECISDSDGGNFTRRDFIDSINVDLEDGFKPSGSFTLNTKDLSKAENGGFSSSPSSAVLSQSADIPTNTNINYILRDDNGNTATVTQGDVDSVVDTSNFTSTTVELVVNLSQSRTNDDKTPTSRDVMVHFKE